MVVIRLARGGDKKNPFYRIVAADKRDRRDGRYIEQLGFFDPMARGQAKPIKLDMDRLEYWEKNGAQFSDRVAKLVKRLRKGEEFIAAKTISQYKSEQASVAEELHRKRLEEEKKAAEKKAAEEAAEKKAAEKAEAEKAKAEAAEKKAAEKTEAEKAKADSAEQEKSE